MGFRFRKRIRLFPGVSLNLSKSGVSTSIGGPGATINVGGAHGTRVTVGIPGTGLSYSETERAHEGTEHVSQPEGMGFGTLLLLGFAVLFGGMLLYALFSG